MEYDKSFSFTLPITITFYSCDFDFMCEQFDLARESRWEQTRSEDKTWINTVWDYLFEGDYPCDVNAIPDEIFDKMVEETKKYYKEVYQKKGV